MGEEQLSIISPWKVVICCSEMFQLKNRNYVLLFFLAAKTNISIIYLFLENL